MEGTPASSLVYIISDPISGKQIQITDFVNQLLNRYNISANLNSIISNYFPISETITQNNEPIQLNNENHHLLNLIEKIKKTKKGPGRPRKDGTPVVKKSFFTKCNFCDMVCRNGIMHQRHIDKYHPEKNEEKKRKCNQCRETFEDDSTYVYHFTDHWQSGQICPIQSDGVKSCAFAYFRRAALRNHIRIYHLPKVQQITNYSQDQQDADNKSNNVIAQEIPPFKCIHCEMVFDTTNLRKRHMIIHTKEKPFECNECRRKFTQKNSLARHIQNEHNKRGDKKMLHCTKCPAKFKQIGNLNVHYKNLHPTGNMIGGKIKCLYCECYFVNHRILSMHVMKYHKEKIPQVEVPTIVTTYTTNKNDILKTALFNSGLATTSDEVKKTKIKVKKLMFPCPDCNKAFKRLYEMKRHSNIHLRTKKYECSICKKGFNFLHNMKNHMQSVHMKNNEAEESEMDMNENENGSQIPLFPNSQMLNEHPILENIAPVTNIITYDPTTTIVDEAFNINTNMLTEIQTPMNNTDNNTIILPITDITSLEKPQANNIFLSALPNSTNLVVVDSNILIEKPNPDNISPQTLENTVNLVDGNYFINNMPLTLNIDSEEVLNKQGTTLRNGNLINNSIENLPIHFLDETSELISTAIDPNLPNMNVNNTQTEQPIDEASERKANHQILKQLLKTHPSHKFPPLAHKCDLCPASFKKRIDLVSHSKIHTGDKPFRCDVCNHNFTSASYLRKHKRLHLSKSEKELYTCDVCDRKFTQNCTMKRHQLIHTQEKPHKCPFCQKVFRSVGNLNNHLFVHS